MFGKLISQVNAPTIGSDKLEEPESKSMTLFYPQLYFAYANQVVSY